MSRAIDEAPLRRLRFFVSAFAALQASSPSRSRPGCRDATQVTLEITLAKRATCAETNGTAITVGTDTGLHDRVSVWSTNS